YQRHTKAPSRNLKKRQVIDQKELPGEEIKNQNTNMSCTLDSTYIVTSGHCADLDHQFSYKGKVIG
ncbi:7246_t:CDS:2, partial [Racocetra fulgida]